MIKRYKEKEINILANILRKDGVISVPTDTVYGICASINSKKGYDKLIDIKNRPINKSFPVMCADLKQIKSIAIVNKNAEKLIHKFMPGPITLVLKKNDILPKYVTNRKNTIAVRMATSNTLEQLIKEVGSPLFMTSANKNEEPVCMNLDEIENKCPLLDGMLEGNVLLKKASTIIDCSSEKVKILREGPISKKQIMEVIDIK